MKFINKYFFTVLTSLMIIVLAGCGLPGKNIAKRNARRYIEEKYGIDAKVNKAYECTVEGLFRATPTGEYIVEMENEGKAFMVKTSLGSGGTDYYRDNYQADEICEALKSEIVKCIGTEPYYCSLMFDNYSYDEFDRKYDNFFHTYFDGTNLYNVLVEDYDGKINLAYVDSTPVSKVDITEVGAKVSKAMHEKENATYFCLYVGLFSFDSVEDFEKNLEKISSNEVFPFTHELRDEFVDMTDAQYISYKAKRDYDKLSYANLEETVDTKIEKGSIINDADETESEADAANRIAVAETMGIAEDSRCIKFIIGHMNALTAGKVSELKYVEENGEQVLYFKSEDGTNYKMILKSQSPTAVQNLDTGEWPVTSEM